MTDTTKLNHVVTAFKLWRQSRANGRAHIPDELRWQAIGLLEDYSTNQITKALGVNYTQLKSWRQQFQVEQTATPADFVPLPLEPAQSNPAANLELELILPNSSLLRIRGDVCPELLRLMLQEAGVQR